jgi:hypothetical protein
MITTSERVAVLWANIGVVGLRCSPAVDALSLLRCSTRTPSDAKSEPPGREQHYP